MRYPIILMLLAVIAGSSPATDAPALAPSSRDADELLGELQNLADNAALSEGRRLELLSPHALSLEGCRALVRLESDLALLALAAGLPDNLLHLLELYVDEDEVAGERVTAALTFGQETSRPLLESLAERGSAPAAAVLYDTFGTVEVGPLVLALGLNGRAAVVAAVALREAGVAAYGPLQEAVRAAEPGALAYAPLIFTAGGQAAVNYLDQYLRSPDLNLRRLTITVLSRLTGTDYGYMMDYEARASDYRREGLPVPPELLED